MKRSFTLGTAVAVAQGEEGLHTWAPSLVEVEHPRNQPTGRGDLFHPDAAARQEMINALPGFLPLRRVRRDSACAEVERKADPADPPPESLKAWSC